MGIERGHSDVPSMAVGLSGSLLRKSHGNLLPQNANAFDTQRNNSEFCCTETTWN